MSTSPFGFLVSPAKAAGVQPLHVWNVGKETETLHAVVYDVTPSGTSCSLTDVHVPWASVSPSEVTVAPGREATAHLQLTAMPAGLHDLGVTWVLSAKTSSGASVTSQVASQLVVGSGKGDSCTVVPPITRRTTVAAPQPHGSSLPVAPVAGAAVGVLAVAVALKATVFRSAKGAHR